MGDLISRQAAIDALDKHIDTFDAIDTNYLCGLRTAMSILKEMPSAQPETHDKRTETHECDLIGRQEAIDAVVSAMIDGADAELVEGVMELLPSADPHWIPCSERMPKEKDAGILKKLGTEKRSEYVLATVEVKGERMTVTACTYDGKWDWNMKYAYPDFKVVAWMPLPKPYGGESE